MQRFVLVAFPIVGCKALHANASRGDRQACLAEVRKYRPDMVLCTDQYSDMADQQAQYDSTYGAHAYLKTNGWSGTCAGMSSGQCECVNWGSEQWAGCTKAYYDEGPGGGHYDIMMNTNAKCVSCGYNSGSMTHNFCGSDSMGPSPSPSPSPSPVPSPAGCSDLDENCAYYVSQGNCASSNQYYPWMTANCKVACGFCGGPSPAPVPVPSPVSCVDSDVSCDYWLGVGYCQQSSEYYPFMTDHCPKACGFCAGARPAVRTKGASSARPAEQPTVV